MKPAAVSRNGLWHTRDYLLLWSGQGVSTFGSRVSGVALPLLVLALTHSPAQAGFVAAVSAVPYLVLSLLAGVLVDRWNRKYLMIACDSVRAVNIASIPLLAFLGRLTVGQLYLNALVEGTCFVLFNVAEVSSLRSVVGKERLAAASAQNDALTNAAGLSGPPLGGLIYQALGHTVPFLIDAVSYAASVMSLTLIRTPFQPTPQTVQGSILAQIGEGVRWLWRQPFIRFQSLRAGVTNFVLSGTYLILIVLAKHDASTPAEIGVMLALGSVGGLLGTIPAPRLQKRFRGGVIVIGIAWLEAILYPFFAIAPNAILLGVIYGLIQFSFPSSNAVVVSYRLALIPEHLQGRVNSAVRMIAYSGVPLGSAVAGILLQATSGAQVVLVYAAILLIVAVASTLSPDVRNLPRA
jgi:MFS family permease